MSKLEVFDQPMCCKTGICGGSADPVLVNFASDLEWIKTQGIKVSRYGISLEPDKFNRNEIVKNILDKNGNSSLPIILFNGEFVSKSCYPTREKLAQICKLEYNEDEAPPIHREENCCCGVDCDCAASKPPQNCSFKSENDFINASTKDNSFCNTGSSIETKAAYNLKRIIFLLFLIIIAVIVALIIL